MENKIEKLTALQAVEVLEYFGKVFDMVRFVDPVATQIIILNKDGSIDYEDYYCYKIWDKVHRCENCISIRTHHTGCRNSKYEFIGEEVYQVVANPFIIIDNSGKEISAVLELVNNSTDEIVFEAFGKSELIEKINSTNRKIYQDSLTGVYNRRYFDEKIFCYEGNINLSGNVVFVMVDLKEFKHINDNYGHDIGDFVLSKVGEALKSGVRTSDSVIRIGGDEFLVILKNCTSGDAHTVVENLRSAVASIIFDKETGNTAAANFGLAATENFAPTQECIENLITTADKKMYTDKNADK